ncbi:MAG: DUF4340 domain-containing protein [Phycisphaerales bacterium]|nr:DUF4340 domain-containing protein [Phycisphaerales bacterium]
MNVRATVVMVTLAIIGVIAAVMFERLDAGDAGAGGAATIALVPETLTAERVDAITLDRADATALRFERDGATWRQTTPFAYPMDAFSIEQLARLATKTRGHAIDADGLTLESVGLTPPRAVLTLETGGQSVRLEFGRRGFGGRAYARSGERLVTIDHELHDRVVRMDTREWRDRRLFHGAGADATRIEVVSGEQELVLSRDRKTWQMERPVRTRVNPLALDELIDAIGRAPAAGFILDEPDDLSRFGMTQPAGTITVLTRDATADAGGSVRRIERTQRLIIGARVGVGSQDRFARVEGRPVVLRLSEAVVAALFRPAEMLVAPTASGVVPADVKFIRIRTAGGELQLRRDLERWYAEEPAVEVRPERAEALLAALTTHPAVAIELQPYPRELEVATVTLVGFDARPLDTIRIARTTPEAGSYWLLENGDDALRVHPETFDLPLELEQFAPGAAVPQDGPAAADATE